MIKSLDVSHSTFVFHKLHSLTGVIPAGVFLFFHFTRLGFNIFKMNSPVVFLIFWMPFLYHVFYGIRIIAHGDIDDKQAYYRLAIMYLFLTDGKYKYYRNYLYLFQRVTAYMILCFIILHLTALKHYPEWIHALWYQIVFILGIVSAVFHFSNGMFGLLSNWGIITGQKAHKRVLVMTFVLFIMMSILGIYNFMTLYSS